VRHGSRHDVGSRESGYEGVRALEQHIDKKIKNLLGLIAFSMISAEANLHLQPAIPEY
jgi:hypothetical protein